MQKNLKIKTLIYFIYGIIIIYFYFENILNQNNFKFKYNNNFDLTKISEYNYYNEIYKDYYKFFEFYNSNLQLSENNDIIYWYYHNILNKPLLNKKELIDILVFLKLDKNNFNNIDFLYFLEELNITTGAKAPFIIHYVISSLFLIIGLLIAVAFFTLFERKVMASMQRRKGPNVVGFWGLLQPLADGLKLLVKEIVIPRRSSIRFFIGSSLYTFLISLLGWCVIPWSADVIFSNPKLSALYVFAVSSLGIYGVLIAGWSSNSKYAFLGGLRSAAQMISYEISLGFILIIIVLFSGTYNLQEIVYCQQNIWYCFPLLPLVIIFFVSMLAETNRAPFDLPEAEAELVSGYNTEYSSIIFAMFFFRRIFKYVIDG